MLKGEMVYYEWAVEERDEHGDAIDVSHYETYKAAADSAAQWLDGKAYDIVLVYNMGCDSEGILERSWAYVDGGKLAETFENGRNVPKRFLKEFERANA